MGRKAIAYSMPSDGSDRNAKETQSEKEAYKIMEIKLRMLGRCRRRCQPRYVAKSIVSVVAGKQGVGWGKVGKAR